MQSMKRSLIFFLGFVVLTIPVFALAQITGNNLVGETGGLVPCSGRDCGTCEIMVLGNRVMRFIIMIMIAGVVLLAAWAGFNLVISGGNPSEYTRAKNMLKNVLIGLILMLVAWLIIDTAMKALLQNSGQVQMSANQWLPWNQVSCSAQNLLTDANPQFPTTSGWKLVVATDAEAAAAANVLYNAPPGSSSNQVCQIAITQGIGHLCSIIQAQMMVESTNNPDAVSQKGAAGLMQLLPGTACDLNPGAFGLSASQCSSLSASQKQNITNTLKSNTNLNMNLGVQYMNQALAATGGNVNNALAYYNGGPAAIQQSNNCSPGVLKWQCKWGGAGCMNGVGANCYLDPAYEETRIYIQNINKFASNAPTP